MRHIFVLIILAYVTSSNAVIPGFGVNRHIDIEHVIKYPVVNGSKHDNEARAIKGSGRQDVSTENPPTKPTKKPQEKPPSGQCICDQGVCKCCSGYLLELISQKVCMRVKYIPEDFAFDIAMMMNERIIYQNIVTGKNPKPVCVSPPRMPNVKLCTKFSNIFFPGRNFHFCASMTGQWAQLELFNVSFDCLRIGAQGIAVIKPEDGGGLPVVNPDGGVDAVVDAGEDDIEDYDENVVKSLLDLY